MHRMRYGRMVHLWHRLVALDLGLGIQLSLQQTLDALQQTFLNTTYRHTEAAGFHPVPVPVISSQKATN